MMKKSEEVFYKTSSLFCVMIDNMGVRVKNIPIMSKKLPIMPNLLIMLCKVLYLNYSASFYKLILA